MVSITTELGNVGGRTSFRGKVSSVLGMVNMSGFWSSGRYGEVDGPRVSRYLVTLEVSRVQEISRL